MAGAGRMEVSRAAAILTGAGMVEFGLQFLLPVILVRHLDSVSFGQYRLLILVMGTALAIVPAFMPQSLYYFLPRAAADHKLMVIGNVALYLAMMGCLVALLTSPANPLLGGLLQGLFSATHGLSALFLGLAMLVSIGTTLAIAEGRIVWHCATDLVLALVRTAMIALAAFKTHQIAWVAAALVADAVLRLLVMGAYLLTRAGGARLRCGAGSLLVQLRYAAPFALGASLFGLRVQADQWIAAASMPAAAFAAFTIGVVVLPVASLIRQPINNALLPHLNTEFAAGNRHGAGRLLRQASAAATVLLLPLAGILFVLAPQIVALVYTERYLAAIPVMRCYLVLVMMQSFAIGYAMPALNMGGRALQINLGALVLSVACSLAGVRWFGLAGAALGSVLAFGLSELINIRYVARVLGTPWRALFPLRLLGTTVGAHAAGMLLAGLFGPDAGADPWAAMGIKLAWYGGAGLSLFVLAGGVAELRRALGQGTAGAGADAGAQRDARLAAAPGAWERTR